MPALLAATLPTGDAWSYEVKWDGYRMLPVKERARVSLYSRNLKDATKPYATIRARRFQYLSVIRRLRW